MGASQRSGRQIQMLRLSLTGLKKGVFLTFMTKSKFPLMSLALPWEHKRRKLSFCSLSLSCISVARHGVPSQEEIIPLNDLPFLASLIKGSGAQVDFETMSAIVEYEGNTGTQSGCLNSLLTGTYFF